MVCNSRIPATYDRSLLPVDLFSSPTDHSTQPVRGDRLSKVLSRSKATAALLALLDHGPLGVSHIEAHVKGYSGSGRELAFAFRDAGLVTIHEEQGRFNKPVYTVTLTALGEEIARLLSRASDQMEANADRGTQTRKRR